MADTPLHPACALIEHHGVVDPAVARLVFQSAALAAEYHWICATGYKAAEVAKVTTAARAVFAQLVEEVGEAVAQAIDDSLFQTQGLAVGWCLDRPPIVEEPMAEAA